MAANPDQDASNFVVHRGEHSFVVLNLYPYITGHLMIVPYLHTLHAMRGTTPSPGAWNAASTRKDWGVLAPPSLGLLVAYHARRPVVDPGGGLDPGRAAAVAEAWRAGDVELLAARARSLEAGFLVVGPTWLDELAAGPAAIGLAREGAAPGGWSRTLASGLTAPSGGGPETVSGPGGPVLSVWRVPGTAGRENVQPALRAR
jgi:hypothetical protein